MKKKKKRKTKLGAERCQEKKQKALRFFFFHSLLDLISSCHFFSFCMLIV